MSRNNLTKGSSSSFKDLNMLIPDPNSLQISHPNLEFQDPRTITFSKQSNSTNNRKNNGKASLNLQTTNTNMSLENFYPYVNINSTKQKGGAENSKKSRIESDKSNNKGMEQDIEKNGITQEDKENNAAILNKISKTDAYEVGKPSRQGPMLVKAVKANIEGQPNKNETKELTLNTEETKFYNENGFKEGQMSFIANKNGENKDQASLLGQNENIETKENGGSKNFEFTLGVFTPDKKTQVQSEPNENGSKWSYNGQQRQNNEEKTKAKTRVQAPQLGYRVQTEAYDTALDDEMDIMAKTFKPIHSRLNKGQREDMSSIQKEADIFKTPKNTGNPLKSKYEEEISHLRNENMRQGEVIEILIDFMKQKRQPSIIQSLNPNLFLGGRQINFSSQPKLYGENNNFPTDSIGGFNEPKKIFMSQNTVKKPNVNIYNLSSVDQTNDSLAKMGRRPPPLEEETPSFSNQQYKPYDISSFGAVFSSPTRHNSKLPKVHDPTGVQRVYSSPVASFIEKNQALPLIAGPRPTKSGNCDNNTRNITEVRDMHKKCPSVLEVPDMFIQKNRLGQKQQMVNGEEGIIRRATDNDLTLRKKESSKSTQLLPSLGKGISDYTKDRLDSLSKEELKYDKMKKHIRRETDLVEPGVENQQFSGVNNFKTKEKILKEVFTLNWKKKSCT